VKSPKRISKVSKKYLAKNEDIMPCFVSIAKDPNWHRKKNMGMNRYSSL
jgi:hypothetical protein